MSIFETLLESSCRTDKLFLKLKIILPYLGNPIPSSQGYLIIYHLTTPGHNMVNMLEAISKRMIYDSFHNFFATFR